MLSIWEELPGTPATGWQSYSEANSPGSETLSMLCIGNAAAPYSSGEIIAPLPSLGIKADILYDLL